MRIMTLVVTIPITLVLIAIAVANRAPVLLSFDPFAKDDPALAVQIPLYLALFVSLILGIVIGGFVAWIAGLRRRLALRREKNALARDLESSAQGRATEPSLPALPPRA